MLVQLRDLVEGQLKMVLQQVLGFFSLKDSLLKGTVDIISSDTALESYIPNSQLYPVYLYHSKVIENIVVCPN